MSTIVFEGNTYGCRAGESVLEALMRQGASPPFSCRAGSCLSCLQKAVAGDPGERAQRALRPRLRAAGYFLPCRCLPTEDLVLAPPDPSELFVTAEVIEKTFLPPDVVRLRFVPATTFTWRAGQFVLLRRPDGLTRPYSLVSLPSEGDVLECHVRVLEGGQMSGYVARELEVGGEVELQGPEGRLFYAPGSQDEPLLLVGSGTGAGPLLAVLRDALESGHRGGITAVIGGRRFADLYLHAEFAALAAQHPQVRYVPCVSGPDVEPGVARGRAHRVVSGLVPSLQGWRVYTAGHPGLVEEVSTWAFRGGAHPGVVHADAFDLRGPNAGAAPGGASAARRPAAAPAEPAQVPEPPAAPEGDAELWQALGEGHLLREILTDFYTEVFLDPILAPYFRGVTQERLIGQVYSFMRDQITGERHYFGARPRKAHHWMVISDAIFDHRERLMEDCLRRHGLAERHVQRWRRLEEAFRGDIVKAAPEKLVLDGVEMPLDGFGDEVLSVGTVCDGCQEAVEVGEHVRYHLRLGLTWCDRCSQAP